MIALFMVLEDRSSGRKNGAAGGGETGGVPIFVATALPPTQFSIT
jgi:hypothetical protein